MPHPVRPDMPDLDMLSSPAQNVDANQIDQAIHAMLQDEESMAKEEESMAKEDVPPPAKQLDVVETDTPPDPDAAKAEPPPTSMVRRFGAKVTYSPKWTHSAAILVLALMLGWPWFLPIMLGLICVTILITYLTLGHDRFFEICAAGFVRLKKFSPEFAETLRHRAEKLMMRLNRIVARLPERWTQGLYLPDFAPASDTHDKMRQDPFEKLQQKTQDG